jgi:hypothetical protein
MSDIPTTPKTPTDKNADMRRDRRFVRRFLFGGVYEFSHPKAANRLRFRARSEAKAWKKLRKSITAQMFGPWALTYNPAAVEKVLAECSIFPPNAEVSHD